MILGLIWYDQSLAHGFNKYIQRFLEAKETWVSQELRFQEGTYERELVKGHPIHELNCSENSL